MHTSKPTSTPPSCWAPNGSLSTPDFIFPPTYLSVCRPVWIACAVPPTTPAVRSVLLLLENLNKEPPDAEVHYLAHTIDEWRWFYEKLNCPGVATLFHRQPRPSGARGRAELHRRHAAAPGPRSPPRRLFSKRPRGTPDPGPRGTSIFRRYSKPGGEKATPATT